MHPTPLTNVYDQLRSYHTNIPITNTFRYGPEVEKSLNAFAQLECRRLSEELDVSKPGVGQEQKDHGLVMERLDENEGPVIQETNSQPPPHQEILDYLAVIRRGRDVSPYYKTSDDRIVHHNVKQILYDVR